MRKRKLRAISLLLAGIMSVGLFTGCSSDSGDNSSDNTDSGGTKDSIVIATSGETPSLSPTEHNAVAGSYMNLLTYNTLFRSGMNLEPEPDLVDTYENIRSGSRRSGLHRGSGIHGCRSSEGKQRYHSSSVQRHQPQLVDQPLTLRAYDSGLQGVEVSDSGTLHFEDVYWEE